MKPAVSLFVVIAVLFGMWSAAAVQRVGQSSVRSFVITPADYERIGEGMRVEDVIELVGAKPTEKLVASGKINPAEKVENITWTDANGRAITVCFCDGVYRHKDQAGLYF